MTSEQYQPHTQTEIRSAVATLARVILSFRPLVDHLETPVRIWLSPEANRTERESADLTFTEQAGLETLFIRIATGIGIPQLTLQPGAVPGDAALFEVIVSNRLTMNGPYELGCQASKTTVEEVIEEVIREGFNRTFKESKVVSFDGVVLSVYEAGKRSDKAVVIVAACGMPAKLCERWMRFLGDAHFVITWESRGLFGDDFDFDGMGHDVAAQVEDLFAVMDQFGVKTAHLMGFCGGAVISLTAAATRPPRVSSLSLWHGDFELGSHCPKTQHQHNLKALLTVAAQSRAAAASIRDAFCQSILLNKISSEWAHLVLYPFASSELLFRYARLNGSIMATNVSSVLERVIQPTLTVTSEDDGTTHSAGSRLVAARLPHATLRIMRHGDHISVFDAQERSTQLASRFIASNS